MDISRYDIEDAFRASGRNPSSLNLPSVAVRGIQFE